MALKQSPLTDAHAAADATLTDFGGWEMPVEFDSIRTEHEAVRESVGKFDVSHMGQLLVDGPDAATLTDRLVTNDVGGLDTGESCYGAITDDEGTILDDTVVYNLPAGWPDDGAYLVIPNAGHDTGMYDRWSRFRDEWDLAAAVDNATDSFAMVALQGRDAADLLAGETDADLAGVDRSEATVADVAGVTALLARTGYTGEPGFELVYPRDDAATLWNALECQPCGLGARDTLRLEMGFLLSGQDFHPEANPRNPCEAGIDFAVDFDREFVGRDALERVERDGPDEQLRGLELRERGVPREGYAVRTADGERLGTVTSGTMSPTLGRGIGLAYLPTEYEPGETVHTVIRDEPKKTRITATPFLDR
jgi:aminomethyltransferase